MLVVRLAINEFSRLLCSGVAQLEIVLGFFIRGLKLDRLAALGANNHPSSGIYYHPVPPPRSGTTADDPLRVKPSTSQTPFWHRMLRRRNIVCAHFNSTKGDLCRLGFEDGPVSHCSLPR